jgi:hypothetical protein
MASTSTHPADNWKKILAVGTTALTWLATTYVFWVGYTGSDDMFYSRYAFLFHRPPINWWEFRMPAVLAIRASFHLFGVSEVTAALPTLAGSLAILASVAWFVGWPARLNWQTQASVILAATLPLDVGLRSTPGAPFLAASFLAVGTVCFLKGNRWGQLLGGACLALGFATHELSIFYISIFCCVTLVFDRRKFQWPVVACVLLLASVFLVECAVYATLLGEPLARFKTAAAESTRFDADAHLSGMDFFAWPLHVFVIGKPFGFDILLLLLTTISAWKAFSTEQRIMLAAMLATGIWLGYGTRVPWAYKPLRLYHYYAPLELGIACLLPATLGFVFRNRKAWAYRVAGGVVAAHLVCCAAGGKWGADAQVSSELLRYAYGHPGQVYLTDVATMNEMYVAGGFRLPANIVCRNGSALERHLLLNKEPPSTPRTHFPEGPIDGILVNLSRTNLEADPGFNDYVREHPGRHMQIVPLRYKPLFIPLLPVLGPREFAIRSQGAELVMPYAGRF